MDCSELQKIFLKYRKLIGHSLEFDASIILDTSQRILRSHGTPCTPRRINPSATVGLESHDANHLCSICWNPIQIRDFALVMCGEASLDPTWPLSKPGVPSIRMIHNHFIVFPQNNLRSAPPASADDVNLTDGGHHGLFLNQLSAVYRRFEGNSTTGNTPTHFNPGKSGSGDGLSPRSPPVGMPKGI